MFGTRNARRVTPLREKCARLKAQLCTLFANQIRQHNHGAVPAAVASTSLGGISGGATQ
jgi:hypothetical protein